MPPSSSFHVDPDYIVRRFGYARPIKDYFWDRVDLMSNDCMEWRGHTRNGYGRLRLKGYFRSAHRVAYELVKGPVPDGMTLDHLCRNRRCVNPDHLEPVTMRVNGLRGAGICAENARKTHCKRGHILSPANTRITKTGSRLCRTCKNEQARQKRRERQ